MPPLHCAVVLTRKSSRMNNRVISVFVMMAIVGVFACASPAWANPRYAARYQQDCHLCHTNPTGGGMRSLYASQFLLPSEMAANFLEFEELEGIDPQIGKNLTVGADVRTLWTQGDPDSPNPQNFFQMQADVYLNFQLNESTSLYLDRGQNGTTESFVQAYWLPWQGYAKVGRFVPAFGWRVEDHTSFTRDFLGLDPPANTDSGVEFGLYPGRTTIQLAAVNGSRGGPFDDDDSLAGVGRIAQRFSLGPLGWAVGGSGYVNDQGADTLYDTGVFGYVNWGRVSYVGETDWRIFDRSVGTDVTGLVSHHELSVNVVRGIDVLATYDFHDPDIDLKTGARRRYGVGVHSLVHHFLAVRAELNVHDNELGIDVQQPDFVEGRIQLHVLY